MLLYAGSGFGWLVDSGRVARAVATSLPILLPAAVLWRGEGSRPQLSNGLVIGAVAVGVGALLESVIYASDPGFGQRFASSWVGGNDDHADLLIVIGLLGLVGPVLLGRSIRGLRGATASPGTVRAGAALAALTVVYVVLALNYLRAFYRMYIADPSEYSGGLFFHDATTELFGVLSLIGWAYFAWAVISASGDGKRPRIAWHLAVAAVVIRQLVLALNILPVAIGLVASPSGEANVLTDVAVAIYLVVLIATPPLAIAASVLLIAAFAVGFGNPRAIEPDAGHVDLQPLPNPG